MRVSAPHAPSTLSASLAIARRFGGWWVGFARARPQGAIGMGFLVVAIVVVTVGPMIADLNPEKVSVRDRYLPIGSPGYLLGTDKLGRDVVSRLVCGGRVSLGLSIVGTVVGVAAGSILSLIATYRGGWLDAVINRVLEVFLSFPTLVLGMFVMAVLGASIQNVVVAISLALAPRASRVVRPAFLSNKAQDYVVAAIAIGSSEWRVMLRHILPNAFAPIIVLVSMYLGVSIIMEASLGFVGLGVPRPTPSWGRDISDSMVNMLQTPWLTVLPGLLISITVLAANTLGDALRDILDPRLRGQR